MIVHKFTLLKEHQGLNPGFYITRDEVEMNHFDKEYIFTETFHHHKNGRITVDLSNKELFKESVHDFSKMQVTVKDLIEYLQSKCDPDDQVGLEHDGWMIESIFPENAQDLIEKRGIFWHSKNYLGINN